jgi:Family of unknown function (DUF5984)
MVFNFRLTPLEQVAPWGHPGDQRLHWFGLTDGEYWIRVGSDVLLEYSETARAVLGGSRYCNYQVARLYEDIVEMLPYVLDPVPASLLPYISGGSSATWMNAYTLWAAAQDPADKEGQYWEVADAALTWIGQRNLDTAYLRSSVNIRFWSDEKNVYIEWDNTNKTVDGQPAWTALSGAARWSRDDFIFSVRSFHDALMSQMGERVKAVLAGALPKHVQIDLQALQREHALRSRPLEREFGAPVVPTDWKGVLRAVLEVNGWAGG